MEPQIQQNELQERITSKMNTECGEIARRIASQEYLWTCCIFITLAKTSGWEIENPSVILPMALPVAQAMKLAAMTVDFLV